jgi:hypothetical protein
VWFGEIVVTLRIVSGQTRVPEKSALKVQLEADLKASRSLPHPTNAANEGAAA